MVENIRNNQTEREMQEVLNSVCIPQAEEIRKFFANAYVSEAFGAALFDSGYMGLFGVIDRNYFIKNYPSIFSYIAKAGTSEAYIGLFKALFGDSTTVTFDFGAPAGTIDVDIVADLDSFIWVTQDQVDNIVTQDTAEEVIFTTLFGELTLNQTESLLKLLVPHGILATFNITNSGTISFNRTLRNF